MFRIAVLFLVGMALEACLIVMWPLFVILIHTL